MGRILALRCGPSLVSVTSTSGKAVRDCKEVGSATRGGQGRLALREANRGRVAPTVDCGEAVPSLRERKEITAAIVDHDDGVDSSPGMIVEKESPSEETPRDVLGCDDKDRGLGLQDLFDQDPEDHECPVGV